LESGEKSLPATSAIVNRGKAGVGCVRNEGGAYIDAIGSQKGKTADEK